MARRSCCWRALSAWVSAVAGEGSAAARAAAAAAATFWMRMASGYPAAEASNARRRRRRQLGNLRVERRHQVVHLAQLAGRPLLPQDGREDRAGERRRRLPEQ